MKTPVIVAALLIAAGAVAAPVSPVRTTRKIAWPAGTPIAVTAIPASVAQDVAAVDIPVLLPARWPAGTPTFVTDSNGYSLSYQNAGASVIIDGTRVAHVPAGVFDLNLASRELVGSATAVQLSGDAWHATTWNDRGAVYKVVIECSAAGDARCASSAFTLAVANALVYAGGSLRTHAETHTRIEPRTLAAPEGARGFDYKPAGELVANSGTGQPRYQELVPSLRFPIESPPAFANSQVWGAGGQHGGGGSECDAVNFAFPWRDDFCETRAGRSTPVCPTTEGHQGQDIRAADCRKNVHRVVAAADGKVTNIGAYSVWVTDLASGVQYRYLHMDRLQVTAGNTVRRGDALGFVSNVFPGGTTVHLHFEVWLNAAGYASTPVGPYTALVAAYQRLLDETAAAALGMRALPSKSFDVQPEVEGYPGHDVPPWASSAATMIRWRDSSLHSAHEVAAMAGEEWVERFFERSNLDLPALTELAATLGLTAATADVTRVYEIMQTEKTPVWVVVTRGNDVQQMYIVTGVHVGTAAFAHQILPACDRRAFDIVPEPPAGQKITAFFIKRSQS